MKILLVDDNLDTLKLFRGILEREGYEVSQAVNGLEALEMAKAEPPSLVISDILMPVMDGFALCREWQEEPGLKEIPFVFSSGVYKSFKDEADGLALGAAAFIRKPTDPPSLLAVVRYLLKERQLPVTAQPAHLEADQASTLKPYNADMVQGLENQMEELLRSHEVLRESERRYRDLYESAAVGLYRATPAGRVTDANETLFKLLKYPLAGEPRELDMGKAGFVREADRLRWLEAILGEESVSGFEAPFKRGDGSTFWARQSARTVRAGSGGLLHYDGTLEDVSERRGEEESLERRERAIQSLFTGSPTGMFILDGAGRIADANPAGLEMFGVPEKAFAVGVDLLSDPQMPDAQRQAARRGETCSFELDYDFEKCQSQGPLLSRRGGTAPLRVLISPTGGSQGHAGGYVIQFDDLAKRKLDEEARGLELVRRMAAGLALAIRGPIRALEGLAATIGQEADAGARLAGFAPAIRDQVVRLDRLLGDLTDLGQPVDPSQFVPVDLEESVRGALERAARDPRISGERCSVTLPPGERFLVRGIPEKLSVVWANLVENALRFSSEKEKVRIRIFGGAEQACVSVEDAGPGMAPHPGQVQFLPFQSRDEGGTGLGLAIVRHVVQGHGGKVSCANNVPGRGATFTVVLTRIGG